MATPRRNQSPLSQIVQSISEDPLEMRWRLDLADWLQRHGQAARAQWIRECCSVWDSISPLALGWGTATGPIIHAPWGIVDLTNSAVYRWQPIRPDYWTETEGGTQTAYFGRIAFTAFEDAGVARLGETTWLPDAYQEGWLESICLRTTTGSQLRLLADWPESHRQLPLFIDTTYFSAADIDNALMGQTLALPGLQGIALSETEVRYPCVKRFAELAPNLRYLRLYLKAVGTSLRVLEQLRHLTQLRSLLIGGSLPDDASIDTLTQVSNLQTLRLSGRQKITDAGLLRVASMPSLRVVAIDVPQVSQRGIEALRSARPDLLVQIEGDMRNRIVGK